MTDREPRYVVDAQPTVRVLDRAYCYRVIKEWAGRGGKRQQHSRRQQLNQADTLAATLNANDAREDAAA